MENSLFNSHNEILLKSRCIFVSEYSDYRKTVLDDILNFRVNQNLDALKKIMNYFHKIAGTSGTLGFDSISSIALENETLIDNILYNKSEYNHKLFSNILLGIAKIDVEFNSIYQQLQESNNNFSLKQIFISKNYLFSARTNKVILIHENEQIANTIKNTLRKSGYIVIWYKNIEIALHTLSNEFYDILILDLSKNNLQFKNIFQNINESIGNDMLIFGIIDSEEAADNQLIDSIINISEYFKTPISLGYLLVKITDNLNKLDYYRTNKYINVNTNCLNFDALKRNFIISQRRLSYNEEKTSIAILKLINSDEIQCNFKNKEDFYTILSKIKDTIKEIVPINTHIYNFDTTNFYILFPDTNINTAAKFIQKTIKAINELRLKTKLDTLVYPKPDGALVILDNKPGNLFKNINELLHHLDNLMSKYNTGVKNSISNQEKLDTKKIQQAIKDEEKTVMPKILLVEDSISLSNLISNYLKTKKYNVITSTNGITGVHKAKSEYPDLVIMDINLPDINGFEAIAKIKKDCINPTLKFIVFTTNSSRDYLKKCNELNIDAYIIKPIQMNVLEERVRELLL